MGHWCLDIGFMAFYKLTVSYDGADFSGWQTQPSRRTVQGELERAWHAITGETVRVTAAGRTDAGVHAEGQVVGVESATRIEPAAILLALNAMLPPDAAVRSVENAPDGFHATTDAKCKRYRYTIYNDHRRPVFWRKYAWHIPTPLDVGAMRAGAQHLVGTHDFVSFQSAGSERESTIRTLFAAEVKQAVSPHTSNSRSIAPGASLGFEVPPSATPTPRLALGAVDRATGGVACELEALITVDVEGDGFLYNMVRSIVGTLAEVGRGKRDPSWIAEVLAARDRTQAGQTAPAHGLTMLWVAY
jgi:tRNA pseudouridine38-40 synthase